MSMLSTQSLLSNSSLLLATRKTTRASTVEAFASVAKSSLAASDAQQLSSSYIYCLEILSVACKGVHVDRLSNGEVSGPALGSAMTHVP